MRRMIARPARLASFLALAGALALGCGSSGKGAGPSGAGGQTEHGPPSGAAGAAAGAAGTAGASTAGASGAAGAGTSGAAGAAGGAGAAGAGGASGAGGQAGGAPLDGGAGSAPEAGTDASALPPGTGCSAAGTICWDFEEGKLPTGWTPYRNEFTTGSLLVDNTRAHGGMYALHAKDFTGGKEGTDGGPKHTIRYNLPADFGPVLWGRAWIYLSPATPMSHAGFFNARYPRPGAPAASATTISTLDWYEVATSGGDYVSIWHPPEPPGTPEAVQISTTPGVVGAWACVEWLFDGQNGTAPEAADPRVFLNGVEIAWPTMIVSPTGAARPVHEKAQSFTVLETGIYLYQGLTTVTNWWIDDLAVGKQRIGCE
jgi:hypothetical protein